MVGIVGAAGTSVSLALLARAGGGGSSGSGDNGADFVVALGFLPCHFVSGFLAKHVSTPLAIVVGSVMAVVISVAAFVWLLPILPVHAFIISFGAVGGVISGSQNIFGKIRVAVKRARQKVQVAAATDSAWQEASLQQTITKTFNRFQQDWSNFNVNSIREYTSPHFFKHTSLMMAALHLMGRKNAVMNPQIQSQFVADLHDDPDNTKDHFTAVITAKADDQLIESKTNNVIYTDNKSFTEFWRFVRDGNDWRLDTIEQATADPKSLHGPIYEFAQKNNMFFSLDWGWLLLPQRGQLFRLANFTKSDLNNHVIGEWNGVVVQLYTYRELAINANYPEYQIAQITLPKSYGGIIIKRKQLFNFTPQGYQKITFEWPDFNQRYVVYATDMDKVTSFELLNPKFMANLYDKNLKVDIEVVDNVVYLYSKVKAGEVKYPEMLEVLHQAFRELKL